MGQYSSVNFHPKFFLTRSPLSLSDLFSTFRRAYETGGPLSNSQPCKRKEVELAEQWHRFKEVMPTAALSFPGKASVLEAFSVEMHPTAPLFISSLDHPQAL